MARYVFGGHIEDFMFSVVGGAMKTPAFGASVTFWTAQTGGSQITDLEDMVGNPISTITMTASGFLPQFQGPDSAGAFGSYSTQMWADGGDGYRLLMTNAEAAAQSAAASAASMVTANDSTVSTAVSSGTLTGAALLASYGAKWKASTAYTAGDVRIDQYGYVVKRITSGTSRSTYDATEAATWIEISEEVHAERFGAVAGGAVDCTAAINAAGATAQAAGSQTAFVKLGYGVFLANGLVNPGNHVGLRGMGSSAFQPGVPGTTIKLGTSSAAVVFGDPNLDSAGLTSYFYSPGAYDFDVDANSTGQAHGALRWDAVNHTDVRNVTIQNATSHGTVIRCGQNNTFTNVRSVNSGRGGTGHDWHLSGGTGGNTFRGCSGGGSPEYALALVKDAGITDVYAQGPAHNVWDHCIFEVAGTVTMKAVVKDDQGGPNVFRDCLFVATNPTDFCVVNVSGPSQSTFNACHIVGSESDGFLISDAGAVLTVKGQGYYQLSTTSTHGNLFTTSVAAKVDFDQSSGIYLISGKIHHATGSGHYRSALKDTITGTKYNVSADEASPQLLTPLFIQKEGDTQSLWFLNGLGGQAWGPGGSTVPDSTLTRDANLGMLFGGLGGGIGSGRFSLAAGSWQSIAGGSTSTTLDASLRPEFKLQFLSGGSPTIAFSNPQNDQRVKVHWAVGTVALTSVAFTGVDWGALGAPPKSLLLASVTSELEFKYDSSVSLWYLVEAPATPSVNPQFVVPTNSFWAAVAASLTTLTGTAGLENAEQCFPFYVGTTQKVAGLQAEVTAVGGTGSVIRLGIRADNAGSPGAVLQDGGTISGTSATVQSVTFTAITLTPGWYWYSVTLQGSPATHPTMRAFAAGDGRYPIGVGAPAAGTEYWGYFQSGVTGALGTFTSAGATTWKPPMVRLKAG